MSIRTFNKVMTSKGCIPVMSFVLLVTMIMSFAGRGCGGQQGPNGPQSEGPQVIATVGDYRVDASAIQARYQSLIQRSPTPPRAKEEATYLGILLGQQIDSGLALIEAKRKNVPLGDADIRKVANEQLEQQLMSQRIQLMQDGKLKGSSDKDFSDALKASSVGKTLEQVRKEQADSMSMELKDPAKRALIQAEVANSVVPKALAAHLKPTDQELNDSYRSLSVKQVLLNGPDVAGQIAKVQADLKTGSSFEAVIDRYSKDKPPVGKKLSEMDAPITNDQLADDLYAPLRNLKPGDVSPVIVTLNGSVIYKILKVKTDLPKDFAKNKETLRTQLATKLADAQFKKDLKDLRKTVAIKWTDPGWHALFDYSQTADPSLKPSEKEAKLKAVVDTAKKAGQSHEGALALYAAVSDLQGLRPGKPDPEFDALRLEAIQAVSDFAAGPDLDLELADIYASKKDGANLGEALAKAARDNTDFSPNGQATFVNIQVKERTNEALLSADAKKQIADAQAAWKQQSDEQQKEQADAAKADADRAKQDAADKKKFEAEQKAEAAKSKSVGTGSVAPPTPNQPPTSKK